MISLKVYDKTAKEVGSMEVSETVFGKEITEKTESLIHQVVVAQLANRRQGTKSALTRTEVSGGGRKPWRQKGTGNARQGSIRAPQWIHGVVVFAPKPRDFSQKVNKTMRRQAIKSALSTKLADGEIIVVDSLALQAAKTKDVLSRIAENIAAQCRGAFHEQTSFAVPSQNAHILYHLPGYLTRCRWKNPIPGGIMRKTRKGARIWTIWTEHTMTNWQSP